MSRKPNPLPIAPAVLTLLDALSGSGELPANETRWILWAFLQGLAHTEPLLVPPQPGERSDPPSSNHPAKASPPPDAPSPNEAALKVEAIEVARAQTVQALAGRVERLEEELHRLRDAVCDTGPPLLTKKAFLQHYPDLYTKSGLDKVLFMREDNGLSEFGAIHQRRKGCRVLIDPKKFLEWYRWFHARA